MFFYWQIIQVTWYILKLSVLFSSHSRVYYTSVVQNPEGGGGGAVKQYALLKYNVTHNFIRSIWIVLQFQLYYTTAKQFSPSLSLFPFIKSPSQNTHYQVGLATAQQRKPAVKSCKTTWTQSISSSHCMSRAREVWLVDNVLTPRSDSVLCLGAGSRGPPQETGQIGPVEW